VRPPPLLTCWASSRFRTIPCGLCWPSTWRWPSTMRGREWAAGAASWSRSWCRRCRCLPMILPGMAAPHRPRRARRWPWPMSFGPCAARRCCPETSFSPSPWAREREPRAPTSPRASIPGWHRRHGVCDPTTNRGSSPGLAAMLMGRPAPIASAKFSLACTRSPRARSRNPCGAPRPPSRVCWRTPAGGRAPPSSVSSVSWTVSSRDLEMGRGRLRPWCRICFSTLAKATTWMPPSVCSRRAARCWLPLSLRRGRTPTSLPRRWLC
jgi:hypothetical protein